MSPENKKLFDATVGVVFAQGMLSRMQEIIGDLGVTTTAVEDYVMGVHAVFAGALSVKCGMSEEQRDEAFYGGAQFADEFWAGILERRHSTTTQGEERPPDVRGLLPGKPDSSLN